MKLADSPFRSPRLISLALSAGSYPKHRYYGYASIISMSQVTSPRHEHGAGESLRREQGVKILRKYLGCYLA